MKRHQPFAALAAAALACATGLAHADAIELDKSDIGALTTWIGEGRFRLERIYTKADGDTSADFHAAVDGKGRTISLMNATGADGRTWLIGGYNPQSWDSLGGFHMTPKNEQRTAFLFNLTTDRIYRQTPVTHILDTVGSYQTYNDSNFGPTFGLGHDLYVPADLTHGGASILYSYVEEDGTGVNQSILDGSYSGSDITIGALEVYTIAVVPEPSQYAMLAGGALLLGWRLRRRARA
jgi:TLD